MIFNLKLSVLKCYTFLKAIRSQIGFYPLEFHSGLNRIQIGFDLPTTYTLLPTHYYRRQFLLPTRCYLLCLPVTCSLLPVTYYLGQLLVLLWTCSRSLLRTAYVAAQTDGWCPYPWIWRRENTNGNGPRPEMKVTNECDTDASVPKGQLMACPRMSRREDSNGNNHRRGVENGEMRIRMVKV